MTHLDLQATPKIGGNSPIIDLGGLEPRHVPTGFEPVTQVKNLLEQPEFKAILCVYSLSHKLDAPSSASDRQQMS